MLPDLYSHRPAFVGELIEMSIKLAKSVVFHRSEKRDLRSKKRDKASKSGTYGNPSYKAFCWTAALEIQKWVSTKTRKIQIYVNSYQTTKLLFPQKFILNMELLNYAITKKIPLKFERLRKSINN